MLMVALDVLTRVHAAVLRALRSPPLPLPTGELVYQNWDVRHALGTERQQVGRQSPGECRVEGPPGCGHVGYAPAARWRLMSVKLLPQGLLAWPTGSPFSPHLARPASVLAHAPRLRPPPPPAQVLRGVRLVFTRVIPLEMEPSTHPLWRLAESFGARCSTVLDGATTHVVAGASGTEKVLQVGGWGGGGPEGPGGPTCWAGCRPADGREAWPASAGCSACWCTQP